MSKKEETKKQLQNKKNRKINEIFRNVKQMLDNVEIAAPVHEAPPPPPAEKEVWSAKVQEIKNLNTGRRRAATDKWNRFAGTSGAGGRGR